MRSHSDDSDYEDDNFENPVAATSYVMGKEGSDSNDSFTRENSNDEYSNQEEQFDKEYTDETVYNRDRENYSDKELDQESSDDYEEASPKAHFSFDNDIAFTKGGKNQDSTQKFKRSSDEYSANSKKRQKVDECENSVSVDASKSSNTQNVDNVFGEGNKAMQMMKMMGYEKGHGLGKNKQGRLEPVQAHKQRGFSGLGFHNYGLEKASLQWDPKDEEIRVKEDMEWLENAHNHAPRKHEMADWLQVGPKDMNVEDKVNFCEESIVKDIINSKSVFDTFDKNSMRYARTRSNPFETIRGAFFLNRAAVKMANIDRACDFMFTNPPLSPNELLYFADVCAGPGGFSEYVFWRKKWHAKGFGFTLKNDKDFKLSDFYAGPCETFYPFYGPKEDGDVYNPSNQAAFRDLIMDYTDGKGVHFMMSDGGFSVYGQEILQEILAKQLYLCQCIVALMIVRSKGHFVTKLFDLFTPFSVGLVYLMYRCFDQVCIFKPNTSRPANSERYLICKGKRDDTQDILQHLLRANEILLKNDEQADVTELVPLDILKSNEEFSDYLRSSNEYIARKQITSLVKIAAYCEDNTLIEQRQAQMRKECLEYWAIPDKTRTAPKHMKPQDKLLTLIKHNTDFFSCEATKLTERNITQKILDYPRSWFYMPSGIVPYTEKWPQGPTFYLGMGRVNTYHYKDGNWIHTNMNLELPADTLIYAEAVMEMRNESKSLRKLCSLHILDAYFLGGEDISQKYIEERHELIKKFCNALAKPTDTVHIRAKDLFPLNPGIQDNLQVKVRVMKNGSKALCYDIQDTQSDHSEDGSDNVPYFQPTSIVFLKSTADRWFRHFSKTHCTTYVFNAKTKQTLFDKDRPSSAVADFAESFKSRCIWHWPSDQSLTMDKVVELLQQKFQN